MKKLVTLLLALLLIFSLAACGAEESAPAVSADQAEPAQDEASEDMAVESPAEEAAASDVFSGMVVLDNDEYYVGGEWHYGCGRDRI